jgi:hypothetical protein
MRLVRGVGGEYSYQYVADQNEVEEKANELRQLKADLVNIDEEALKSSLENIYDVYDEWLNKVQEMVENGATEAEIETMTEQYTTRMATMGEEARAIWNDLSGAVASANEGMGLAYDAAVVFPWINSDWAKVVLEGSAESFGQMFT